jgi:hypothetical protein
MLWPHNGTACCIYFEHMSYMNYVVVMFNYIDLLINFYMYDIYEVRKHQTPATHLYVCLTFGMAPNQTPTTLFCHA